MRTVSFRSISSGGLGRQSLASPNNLCWLIKAPTGQKTLFSTFPKDSCELERTGHYEVMVQISVVNPCSTSWQRETVKCLAVTGSCQRGIIFLFVPVLERNVYVSVQINILFYIFVSVQYYGTLHVASYRISSVECKRHVAIGSGKFEQVIMEKTNNNIP